MGIFASKIPAPVPGQELLHVGLEKIDLFYKTLERPVKVIDKLTSEMDTRTTDLIKSLGASNVWEVNPDFEKIVAMVLTVLATVGKGFVSQAAILSESSPFIELTIESPSRRLKKIITNYSNLMDTITSLSAQLENCSISASEIAKSRRIRDKIVKKLISSNYSMKDKLEIVKIINKNHQKIKSAPQAYSDLLSLHIKIPELSFKLFKSSSIPPFSNTLLERGIQASLENLSNPLSITQKFWPII